MLKQRIVTALALLAVLIPALLYPSPTPFLSIALLLMTAGAWEWGRLNGLTHFKSLASALACSVICLGGWVLDGPMLQTPWLWILGGLAWTCACIGILVAGPSSWQRIPLWVRMFWGMVSLSLAWLALAQARVIGANFLLSILLLVWAADIFAYFVGRAMGGRIFKRRLAPSISPGKSWEGVLGGALGVICVAFIWTWLDGLWAATTVSLYTRLFAHGSGILLFALVYLIAMSVMGDLVESLIKRSAGVKDSSNLLPGHGGVLDRVDAMLPVLPLAMMWHSVLVP
ncbi:MAG: phosphatidate cytidylyltransferase [Burkholderiaceae bacterium]